MQRSAQATTGIGPASVTTTDSPRWTPRPTEPSWTAITELLHPSADLKIRRPSRESPIGVTSQLRGFRDCSPGVVERYTERVGVREMCRSARPRRGPRPGDMGGSVGVPTIAMCSHEMLASVAPFGALGLRETMAPSGSAGLSCCVACALSRRARSAGHHDRPPAFVRLGATPTTLPARRRDARPVWSPRTSRCRRAPRSARPLRPS